jgi:antitoxin component YwqK of YwqJK toxin-antitoxin module
LALNNFRLKFIAVIFFISLALSAYSADWYISNAAGMILEKTFSRAALRQPYALNIETLEPNRIPAAISKHIDSAIIVPESYDVEFHTLYENGVEKNQRWLLRFPSGITWLVISNNEAGGFAEYYDASGLLIQEDTFSEERTISIRYSYSDEILLHSETWQIPQKNDDDIFPVDENDLTETNIHLWSDEYHYARAGSLRSIERTFHPTNYEIEDTIRLSNFAPLGPNSENVSVINSSPALSSDFISDIINVRNTTIEYVTDERGRIISEIHKDEEGNKIGELLNTWIGERLASMSWNGENDVRRIEYEYDENGNRIIERNYRDGNLERIVRTEEDGEVEELYLQGQLHLRAVWKDGQKISEEYFRQSSGRMPSRIPNNMSRSNP